MLALKSFRSTARGVADLLNWAALIDAGLVLCKDGTLLAGWFFQGPDAASMTEEERNYLTARVNAAITHLGSEYALWIDAVRMPAAVYPLPSASHFPDRISAMIDEERRAQFLKEGAHFETEHALILAFTPPLRRQSWIQELIYSDDEVADPVPPSARQFELFRRVLTEVQDMLGDVLRLRRMGGFEIIDGFGRKHLQDELVNYLHFALTGELGGLNVPPCAMYLDALIGGQEMWPGDTPKIGERFIACLAIEGLPAESVPLMLSVLDDVPVAYRFSTRFLPLDQVHALTELHRYRRKWIQKRRGLAAQIFRTQGGVINEDAVVMTSETERAISEANSALVTFGYYTPVLVLMGPQRTELADQARLIAQQIRRLGFATRIETVNTVEAWLGTLPGHRHPNVRRPLIHSLNLADLIPLTAQWPGLAVHPNPMYPPGSPPLMHAATTGATPFRLNLHVGDVGHTLVFGATGAGKSVLLGMIAAQHLRYPGARVTVFDKGRSIYGLATACGAAHYDLAGDGTARGLCPLAEIDSDSDAAWAEDYLATLYQLQTGEQPLPKQKQEIHRAISLLRQAPATGRTLTDFLATVQDQPVRDALAAYTLDGPYGSLLDARQDEFAANHFTVFEMDELMGLGERILLPVLLALFRRFERSLDGAPALLILDEAWIMLGHPVFREKIREWLKTLRKANCAVVLATQSLSDAARSQLLDVLLESCPTKILLPNEEADKPGSGQVLGPYDLYKSFGLNDAEIAILKTGIKKRDYYAISSDGRRLFELRLGALALTFLGASSREQIAELRSFQDRHGEDWPFRWLEHKGGLHDKT